MQSVLSRMWTRVVISISYDDNHYTTDTSLSTIPPEVWKTTKFDDLLLRYCNTVYSQNTIEGQTKGCILPFPKKDDLGIAKNYRSITLTSIAAKVYNALLLKCIEPEIEKIIWKNQNGFWGNRSTTSQILRICRILGDRAKNLEVTYLFVDFSKSGESIHRWKNTSSVWSPQRNYHSHNDAL